MQPDTDTTRTLIDRLRLDLATAQATDKARLEELADLSHELKTPINGLLGILGLLRKTDLDAEQHEMVDLMWDAVESQAQLVVNLNRTCQIDDGVEPVDAVPFSAQGVLASVIGLIRPAADVKGIAIRFEMTGLSMDRLLGDEKALRQIAINIVGNAVKFTRTGEVAVHAAVAPLDDEHTRARLRLTVTDTGPGIPANQREHVFGRFARGATTAEGSGLGLHICKSLVEVMDGTITMGEAPNGGCFVTVDLPFVSERIVPSSLTGVTA